MEAARLASLPPMIQNLIQASKLGRLDESAPTVQLLNDISVCLKNGTSRGRILSPASKIFYGMLLNNGSAWAHKFVSGVLFGPDLRTSQKARAAFDTMVLEDGLKKESLAGLFKHLENYAPVQTVPGIISEDATTGLRRIDAEMLDKMEQNTDADTWKAGVKLWGFDGTNSSNTRSIYSVEDLRVLIEEKTALAGYVYVYTWVPVLPGAPWFPFAIIATDNRFDNEWVFARWRLMHTACSELELPLAGHISDGDARLRKCDFRVNYEANHTKDPREWVTAVHKLDHPLLFLSLAETTEGLVIYGHQDYMHLAWRLRVQLLSPARIWDFGGYHTPQGIARRRLQQRPFPSLRISPLRPTRPHPFPPLRRRRGVALLCHRRPPRQHAGPQGIQDVQRQGP